MYIQEILININSKSDKDEIIDNFNILMAHYRGNGQSQGKIETQYISGNRLVSLPFTLEKTSLDHKFNNYYVDRQSEIIEDLCKAKIEIRLIGKSYHTYKSPCKCKKSDFYILVTNYITIESPITCGTCNKPVPLYRLPKYDDQGYMPILSWETNYISCDSLQMNFEVGERWALNQMQNVKSALTRQGMEICEKLENITNTPTYYYLYNYKKYKREVLTKLCPSCKSNWGLNDQLSNLYDFKCANCRLVSTISLNS